MIHNTEYLKYLNKLTTGFEFVSLRIRFSGVHISTRNSHKMLALAKPHEKRVFVRKNDETKKLIISFNYENQFIANRLFTLERRQNELIEVSLSRSVRLDSSDESICYWSFDQKMIISGENIIGNYCWLSFMNFQDCNRISRGSRWRSFSRNKNWKNLRIVIKNKKKRVMI